MPLKGVGVDVERIERFVGEPLSGVFRVEEHCRASRGDGWDAARLCAGFCVKEALWKALREPYDPRECEVIADPRCDAVEVRLHGELAERLRENALEVRIGRIPGEIWAVVTVRDPGPFQDGRGR